MNLPVPFITEMSQRLGDDFTPFQEALNLPASVSLRVHPQKCENELTFPKVPWATDGYYLQDRPVFTLDPLFHAGCYYVQEASSMLLEQAIRHTLGDVPQPVVLDLCAAPGGKSTHLSASIGEEGLLVANEVIRSRASILVENLTKWGEPNTIVTNNDPKAFGQLGEFVDLLVVDAPCSGEGLFRKEPASRDEWSPQVCDLCVDRQRRILTDALPCLKTGGHLIYSTCTYNRQENEQQIEWLISHFGMELVQLHFDPSWGFSPIPVGDSFAYQAYPHRVRGEGFFLALLRKTEPINPVTRSRPKSSQRKRGKRPRTQCNDGCPDESRLPQTYVALSKKKQQQWRSLLITHQELGYFSNGAKTVALPKQWQDLYIKLQAELKVISFGIELGEEKKHGLVPSHALAMSRLFNQNQFPGAEVDRQTALRYLRREPIKTNLPKGLSYVRYHGHPLGWLKELGNRSNNRYPQSWRIRMQLPEERPWSIRDEMK